MTRALMILVMLLACAAPARAEPVRVFAAASLKTALDRIATDYQATTGSDVRLSYAGSSVLARQIALGAPADVFLSANTAWMQYLDDQGLIARDTRRDLLSNSLVVIARRAEAAPLALGRDTDLAARLGDGVLAMALVDAVPAGLYGKAALRHFGLWDSVADRVAQADNVRAALRLVAVGEAALGIVYATDALAEPDVTVVASVPPGSHPLIRYPVAALTGRDAAAAPFLEYLATPKAARVFADAGFTVLGPE